MTTTVIKDVSPDQFTQRLLRRIPVGWFGDDARQAGGKLYGMLASFASELTRINQQIQYAFDTCRIATAEDVALDAVSVDFNGPNLPRNLGEPDSSFRARIQASLLQPMVTRKAISDAIERLVGSTPRMIEPWNTGDCGAYDTPYAYYDTDTVECPFRWADPGLRYQGLIESPLPNFSNNGGYAVYGYDAGGGYDKYSSAYFDTIDTWYITPEILDNLINSIRAYGVTIWRRYYGQPLTNVLIGNTLPVGLGVSEVEVPLDPAINGSYSVLLLPSWNASANAINLTNTGFSAEFSTPAPMTGCSFDLILIPTVVPGAGIIEIPTGSSSYQVGILPAFAGCTLVVGSNWNSSAYIESVADSLATIGFGNLAPLQSQLSYWFAPANQSGAQGVTEGETSATISLAALVLPYQFVATPNWNTSIEVLKSDGSVTLDFSTPAPSGASINFAYNLS